MKTGMTGSRSSPTTPPPSGPTRSSGATSRSALASPILVTFQGDLADQRTQALLKNVDKLVASDDRFTVVGYEAAEEATSSSSSWR